MTRVNLLQKVKDMDGDTSPSSSNNKQILISLDFLVSLVSV